MCINYTAKSLTNGSLISDFQTLHWLNIIIQQFLRKYVQHVKVIVIICNVERATTMHLVEFLSNLKFISWTYIRLLQRRDRLQFCFKYRIGCMGICKHVFCTHLLLYSLSRRLCLFFFLDTFFLLGIFLQKCLVEFALLAFTDIFFCYFLGLILELIAKFVKLFSMVNGFSIQI